MHTVHACSVRMLSFICSRSNKYEFIHDKTLGQGRNDHSTGQSELENTWAKAQEQKQDTITWN